ncbi:hypothetical protein [Kerstersia gyiorum]|jgi:hypothetical protein|uniref:hypothetical protein n=1 Tax=Kerstersia gyiorum TaxID=206506 RepID=UPI0020A1C253|nr:hypothetical protein [Kerstersia gyiorum]MCP1634240.1 hypothetical protein [Kerstersia gyiorum]MCP1638158.1 hypothetical protein [Kerstersia gyiorum]MCP1672748.1 hypothetical protein [Kerstersia gyiorum]MCP1680042.1 hypothetical protein [Kerstersia gyiorum]MCP1683608.1 hypothetical protein [Kerstersia gyiorum]
MEIRQTRLLLATQAGPDGLPIPCCPSNILLPGPCLPLIVISDGQNQSIEKGKNHRNNRKSRKRRTINNAGFPTSSKNVKESISSDY